MAVNEVIRPRKSRAICGYVHSYVRNRWREHAKNNLFSVWPIPGAPGVGESIQREWDRVNKIDNPGAPGQLIM